MCCERLFSVPEYARTGSITTVCAQVYVCTYTYVLEFGTEHFWLLSQVAESALQYFWASIQGLPLSSLHTLSTLHLFYHPYTLPYSRTPHPPL